MKRIILGFLSGALAVGIASAQDAPTAQAPQSTQPQQSAAPSMSQPAPGSRQDVSQSATPPDSAAAANSSQTSGPRRLAPGNVIPVQLAKTIDAKKAKTGEEVVAKVTADLKSNNGDVLVAKDTKIIGHVTQAQTRSKEQKESELGIAFDRAVTKTGEMQMPMSIQAIIGPQNSSPDNSEGSSSPQAPAQTASGAGAGMPSSNRNAGTNNTMPNGPSGSGPTETGTGVDARPRITASTQGVIGISNLKLAPAGDTAQGSLLSSDKNNVKLEGGTMMLLRVNQ